MQTTRPRITWKVYQWLRVAIFKEIFDQVQKRFRLWIVLFWTKTSRNVSHYIYYLATDNIHIVLENDNTVLIKGLKKVVNVKFSRNTHLIETSWVGWNQEKSHFQQYRENLAKAGVFRWVINIHEHKRYYYTFDNSLLFTESIQNTTQIFPLNHNVQFSSVSAPGRWHNAQYVYALNPVCIVLSIPGHSMKVPRQGCGHG